MGDKEQQLLDLFEKYKKDLSVNLLRQAGYIVEKLEK